ncbi:MAG: transcriptional regulator [Robiginitomaculum sp.]|nr:MAG: transcriptional regulator [Robiginitomaculum sp.]
MILEDLMKGGAVVTGLRPTGKKQALHLVASKAANTLGLSADALLKSIMDREQLGSTGVGGGVAIPHASCAGLNAITGFFFRLENSIDFDAIDDGPVDLVFLLLAPDEDGATHLRALAQVSRVLRRPDVREKIRNAPDDAAIMALLCGEQHSNAA